MKAVKKLKEAGEKLIRRMKKIKRKKLKANFLWIKWLKLNKNKLKYWKMLKRIWNLIVKKSYLHLAKLKTNLIQKINKRLKKVNQIATQKLWALINKMKNLSIWTQISCLRKHIYLMKKNWWIKWRNTLYSHFKIYSKHKLLNHLYLMVWGMNLLIC